MGKTTADEDEKSETIRTGDNHLQGRVTWLIGAHDGRLPLGPWVQVTMEFVPNKTWQTGRLKVDEARRIAAAILRAADAAEGKPTDG